MFSQSCVSGFHRISDHGESRRARLSATTTPSWRHIWSSTHTKRPSLDHTRNCQPSPNQLSNFNLQQGSPPPTQSLPQIPSSTRTKDPTSFHHPPTEYLIVSSKPPTGYCVDGVTECSVSRASAGFTEYLIMANLDARDCLPPPPHLGDTFGHPRTPNHHP